MFTLALLAVIALIVTLAITPLCRSVCNRYGWVDQPDPRKTHRWPIPRTGGIAIFLGYSAALAWSHITQPAATGIWALLPAAAIAFTVGLLDDLFNLRPHWKLLGQILAAALACHGGVQIENIAGFSIADTWWHTPLTIFWLVACANAFNLIDGLDGLAAGVGLFATATAFLSALINGNTALALVTVPLLGALLGFLPYNFSPASIFMGDCGSNTVGFLLGCFGVIWSSKSATILGMTAPLIAMAIPLLDTALSIARRFLRRQHIFGADRGHIHHRLLARGFTPRRVAYVFYASAGVFAGLSLLLTTADLGGVALVAFCVVVWLAIQYLGYDEFDAARRVVFGGSIRRAVNADLCVRQLEQSIESARTLDECWEAILVIARGLGLSSASMCLGDRQFYADLIDADPAQCWNVSIPLDGSGHVQLSVPFVSGQPPATVGPLAASLRTLLAPKLTSFSHHISPPSPRVKTQTASAAFDEVV